MNEQSTYIINWGKRLLDANGESARKDNPDDWVSCMAKKFHRRQRQAMAWLKEEKRNAHLNKEPADE